MELVTSQNMYLSTWEGDHLAHDGVRQLQLGEPSWSLRILGKARITVRKQSDSPLTGALTSRFSRAVL